MPDCVRPPESISLCRKIPECKLTLLRINVPKMTCTLKCRWCAPGPCELLLRTGEDRPTRSWSGTVWLFTGGSCVFLLIAGSGEISSAAGEKEIKLNQDVRSFYHINRMFWDTFNVYLYNKYVSIMNTIRKIKKIWRGFWCFSIILL